MNLFSLTWQQLQGGELYNDKNNKVLDNANTNIVLEGRIKTIDGWVAGVEFIHEKARKKANALKKEWILHSQQAGVSMTKSFKDVNELHLELWHPSKFIK